MIDGFRQIARIGPIAILAAQATAVQAQPPAAAGQGRQLLSPSLAPLQFLVGTWHQTRAKVRFVSQSKGSFTIEPAVGGMALLRRDHNDFLMMKGHDPSYEQIMLIYPERGKLRADWFDGLHAIHYTSVMVDPGRSVRFASAIGPGQPSYRLTYTQTREGVDVRFEQAPPNSRAFRAIAEGSAAKS